MNPTARRSHGVVIGVDGTQESGHAARWAAREAVDRGTILTVVHALGLPKSTSPGLAERRREEGASLLGRAVGHLANQHPDLIVDTVLDERGPARALTEFSLDAELVVTGRHGRGRLTALLFGSVSGAVADRAHCPVVVVSGEQRDSTKPEAVLGLEPDEDTAPIDFAFRTAARLGLQVRAVRAFEPASAYDGAYVDDVEVGRRDALIGMGSLLHQFRETYPEVPVFIEAECGDAVPVLRKTSRDARLLIVGAHRRRGGPIPALGGTVQELLTRPGTPVAVVPLRDL